MKFITVWKEAQEFKANFKVFRSQCVVLFSAFKNIYPEFLKFLLLKPFFSFGLLFFYKLKGQIFLLFFFFL